MDIIIIVVILIAYFIFTKYVNNKINKSLYLNESRRNSHKIFIWIIPFLGPLIIRNFWKTREDNELEIMTKKKRKQDKSNFYESGKGIRG